MIENEEGFVVFESRMAQIIMNLTSLIRVYYVNDPCLRNKHILFNWLPLNNYCVTIRLSYYVRVSVSEFTISDRFA